MKYVICSRYVRLNDSVPVFSVEGFSIAHSEYASTCNNGLKRAASHERLIEQALNMFEGNTGLGPAIRGQVGGDSSGYQVNQLIQASMLSLQPALDSYDWMLADIVAYMWRLIERRIEQDVWVMGTNSFRRSGGS